MQLLAPPRKVRMLPQRPWTLLSSAGRSPEDEELRWRAGLNAFASGPHICSDVLILSTAVLTA